MDVLFSPRQRAERLIAAGRVVLASSSLIALWRDPSEPAKYAPIAYALLIAYLAYASFIALIVWRQRGEGRAFGLLTHSFDLAFFSAFMYFTSGPASPFIAYFVFSLLCATLRWQWRGTLWTAIATLTAYFGLGYYFAEVLRDRSFEPNGFIIRGVYMAVMAFLLAQLGVHEQRSRQEMALLAHWPLRSTAGVDEAVDALLEHAARIHGAALMAVSWASASEAPRMVVRTGDKLEWIQDLGSEEALVAPTLADASFLAPAGPAKRGENEILVRAEGELERWHGEPLGPRMRNLSAGRTLVSAPWRAEISQGRIFAVCRSEVTSDDLLLAEIVAALVGARIDGLLLSEAKRTAAAAEERIRLARDLHDGVLQSMTGIGLRVAAARRLLSEAPEEAQRSLDELLRLVAVEQRDLRFFIQDLEPSEDPMRSFDLAPRLAELVHRLQQEWGLTVTLATESLEEEMPEEVEREIYFLVRESLVNAVRHGSARHVEVRIERRGDERVEIYVKDDGHGFPFSGRFDRQELVAMNRGPRSLRDRVGALGGELALESSERGASLQIGIPL